MPDVRVAAVDKVAVDKQQHSDKEDEDDVNGELSAVGVLHFESVVEATTWTPREQNYHL